MMTDDELKTRLRHSADVLRDMLYDDLAEGCSRTVQRIDALRAELEAAKRDAELLRDAANRIEGDDVLARLRSGNATPEDQYNVANSLAYLWAQDGLLSEAQQEVDQLRDQLAEVERKEG
jgi:hypothetical protein